MWQKEIQNIYLWHTNIKTNRKLNLPILQASDWGYLFAYITGGDERSDEQSNWEIPELNFKQKGARKLWVLVCVENITKGFKSSF